MKQKEEKKGVKKTARERESERYETVMQQTFGGACKLLKEVDIPALKGK